VAELVDAPVLGAGGGNPVKVQVLSSAPFFCLGKSLSFTSAQVAELVDALASGASGGNPREGSSPFLGTIYLIY
jgi:hypothetical protein